MQSAEKGETAGKLLEPGDMFGDYTVEKLLGKGGMGAVYLVRAPDGARYAVKLMFPEIADKNRNFRTRFAREAEFAMKIRHKNLISVYDVGQDPDTGYCYIIMDYVPGGSVKERLAAKGAFPIAEAVSIVAQISLALEVAHRHGVIHRDIKPDNIMFDADGTPKLADLGVAKFDDDEHKTTVTTAGMIIGTPAYMAPEQMIDSHHIDARADIYALGVVLYEMITGKRPTAGSTAVELLAKAMKGESLPDIRTMRPEVSAAIAHVLSLMCAPKPMERPSSSLVTAQLLQKAAAGQLRLPKKKPRAVNAQQAKRTFPVTACVVGALVIGAVLFGWRASQKRTVAKGVPPVGGSDTRVASQNTTPPLGSGASVASASGWTLPDSFVTPLEKTLTLPSGEKIVFAACPAGTFQMSNSDKAPEITEPAGYHTVTIKRPFWISKKMVTARQLKGFLRQDRQSTVDKVAREFPDEDVVVTMQPRAMVAERFCDALNRQQTSILPSGYVFRLPSEAELEYAWRTGTGKVKIAELGSVRRTLSAFSAKGWIPNEVPLHKVSGEYKGVSLQPRNFQGNAWGIGHSHSLCYQTLDRVQKQGNNEGTDIYDLTYASAETDPVRTYGMSDGVSLARRNYDRHGRMDNFTVFHVVIGPDLMKERGITLPKPSEKQQSAASGNARYIPKATSPRPKSLVLDLGGGVEMEMVGCPAGKFWMGMQNGGNPVQRGHEVEITRPFYFGKFPVTISQWERLMPAVSLPSGLARKDVPGTVPVQCLTTGVIGLTRVNAETYISKLTERYGRQLPAGYVFRLPTSAEWEYALKANSTDMADPYVSTPSEEMVSATFVTRNDCIAFWEQHGFKVPAKHAVPYLPVGKKRANKWGIYDMGGVGVEPVLDSYVETDADRLIRDPWERLVSVFARAPHANFERDPLRTGVKRPSVQSDHLRSIDRHGYCDNLHWPPATTRSSVPYWFDGGNYFRPYVLRIVAGPDLLKERRIAPPVPDENGRDASPVSAASSPKIEPFKLLSERPKPLTIKLGKGEQLELMGCPAGTFTMGCDGCGPMHAPHKVTISRPFWAGKYPVTRAQWDMFMPPRHLNAQEIALGGSKGAASNMSRKEADEYCELLTKRFGNLLPKGYVFRLPTVSEAEYFWRTDSQKKYDLHAKPSPSSEEELAAIAVGAVGKQEILRRKGVTWEEKQFSIMALNPSVEVGLRRPNAWGIHDMSGNVGQWVLDMFPLRKAIDAQWGVKGANDLAWSDATDPLFWSDDGLDGTGLFLDSVRMKGWAQQNLTYARHGEKWKVLGFRLVAGPDLVAERYGKSVGTVDGQTNATRSVVIFPRADTQSARWKKRAPWRYTTKAPPSDWAQAGFKDTNWKRTNKPVGFIKDEALMRIAERWMADDIWLRRHFNWNAANVKSVTFDIICDDDAEIYLNGTLILENKRCNSRWEPFIVPVDKFLSAVRDGDNVLAVKAHDRGGNRYFDCGLTVEVEDDAAVSKENK